jgi:hypothetical protein
MVQVIVINSINQNSGKTLIAAHLAVMLAKDYKVALMDDVFKSELSYFVAKRYNLNMQEGYNLAVPEYHSLNKSTFSQIEKYDVVILDAPNRQYFQYADIFITPLFGQDGFESLSDRQSLYASLIWDAKKQRASMGKNAFKWIAIPNDAYSQDAYKILSESGKILGFGVAPTLPTRKEFSEGLNKAITVLDKDIPQLKTLFDLPDLYARRDLKKLADFIWQNK